MSSFLVHWKCGWILSPHNSVMIMRDLGAVGSVNGVNRWFYQRVSYAGDSSTCEQHLCCFPSESMCSWLEVTYAVTTERQLHASNCSCIGMGGMTHIFMVCIYHNMSNFISLLIVCIAIYLKLIYICISGWSHRYTNSITGKAKSLLQFHGIYGHTAQPLPALQHARSLALVTLNLQSPRSFLLIDIETLHNTEKES